MELPIMLLAMATPVIRGDLLIWTLEYIINVLKGYFNRFSDKKEIKIN